MIRAERRNRRPLFPPLVVMRLLFSALVAAGGELPTDRKFGGVNLIPHLAGDKQGKPKGKKQSRPHT